MPKIAYIQKRFTPDRLKVIQKANEIINEYSRQGFSLTLRQLYYQFVSRDLIANNMREYKKLGDAINDARLAGLIDWNAIEDRTRSLRSWSTWKSPSDIISACASQFSTDWWEGQDVAFEVWIEKDALVGVIEPVCRKWQTPYFSCRGYTSQSEMWSAAQRLADKSRSHRDGVIVLHLGDHDPSGIDMTRDIIDRIKMFGRNGLIDIKRIALNQPQVDQYNPPPNPAKMTDSRFDSYLREHGDECWELDALEPSVIAQLIEEEIEDRINSTLWNERKREQSAHRQSLEKISLNYDAIITNLDDEG